MPACMIALLTASCIVFVFIGRPRLRPVVPRKMASGSLYKRHDQLADVWRQREPEVLLAGAGGDSG